MSLCKKTDLQCLEQMLTGGVVFQPVPNRMLREICKFIVFFPSSIKENLGASSWQGASIPIQCGLYIIEIFQIG